MKHVPWREICWAIGFLTLSIGIYIGAYFALVDPRPTGVFMGVGPWRLDSHYRFGTEVNKVFFAPLEAVDRKMRPGRWEFRLPTGWHPAMY
jgi:hypothetical protein